MKKLLISIGVAVAIMACSSTANNTVTTAQDKTASKGDTVRIANDSLEYEVIITDIGFNTFLASRAKPRNYFGLNYLETRNYFLVSEYNRRVLDPYRYNPNLYEMRIDYDPKIKYGYEVNYLLYNYFLFFQQQYRQKL